MPISHNTGPCKRFWDARKRDFSKETKQNLSEYDDVRIDTVVGVLGAVELTALAGLLYDTAVDFEYTDFERENEKLVNRPLLDYPSVITVFTRAGEWFRLLAALPYDATFGLMPLLDCLEFFMGNRYGKFQLVDVYKIEVLQLGFGFVNQVGRQQWVYTIESLLYTFNVQCKFMMPCKHMQPALIISKHFSHFRGISEGTSSAVSQLSDLVFQELNKSGLQVLLHYFSMPSRIDYYLNG